MPVLDIAPGQNPQAYGVMSFGVEGATPGFTVDTSGNVVISGTLTASGSPIIQVAGLDPTGVVDATATIQAAINSIPTDSGGFTFLSDYRGTVVQMPFGRLRVTGQITTLAGLTLAGAGPQSTVLVNEGTNNHVLYFLGADAGTIDPLCFNNFAIAQKSGVTHTTGDAIHVDGGGFGCTVNIENVTTYATYRGFYFRDTYLSRIARCEGYLHTTNAFLTDVLCTSINFDACYSAACTGSGFKIFGNYMTLKGCGSDSNTLDGYEIYYNGGSTVSIALIGCGAEGSGRNGISADRVVGLTISSPRLIAPAASAQAGIKLDGGNGIVIQAPVVSSLNANVSPAITLVNTSGAYPIGTTIIAMSQATNYSGGLFDQSDRVFHISDQTGMGLGNKGFRIGPITNFTADLQGIFIGNTPAGSGAIAYGLYSRPVAGAAHTTFAALKGQPEIAFAGVSRAIAAWCSSPIVTSGSLTRAEGVRIDDITGGSTANVNMGIGSTVAATGNWSIYNVSTRDNLMGGKIIMGATTGPQIITGTGTPEGAVTAPIGSMFMRSDGGAATSLYVKESGTGNTGWVGK